MLTTKVGGLEADSVNVAGTSTIAGQTFISDTTSSVSSISGALRVNGGVGILGDIHVGGTIYGTVASGTSTDWSSLFNFTNTTNSTSTNTGAVVVAGGLGIGKTISASKVVIGNSTSTGAGPLSVNSSATGSYGGYTAPAATLIGRNNPLSYGLVGSQSATVYVVNDDPYDGDTSGREASIGFRTRGHYDGNSPTTYAKIGGSTQYGTAGYYGQMNFEVLANNSANLIQVMNLTDSGLAINPNGAYSTHPSKPLDVIGNAGVSGQLTAGSLLVSGGVNLTSNTAASSTGTGALIVSGGIGCSGTIYAKNAVFDSGTGDNFIVVAGGGTSNNGIQFGESGVFASWGSKIYYASDDNLHFGMINNGVNYDAAYISTSSLWVKYATAATSTSSGAIITYGGAGFGKTVYAPSMILNGGTASTTTGTGALIVTGGIGASGAINSSTANIVGGVASTTTSNGSLVVTGGAGISGDLRVGGTIYGTISGGTGIDLTQAYHFTNTTDSTSTSTGALITDGGMGIKGKLYVGGTIGGYGINVGTATFGGLSVNGGASMLSASVTGGTASTSTSTGAVVIAGGLGVSGDIYANNIYGNVSAITSVSTYTTPLVQTTPNAGPTAYPTFTLIRYGRLRTLTWNNYAFTLNGADTFEVSTSMLTIQGPDLPADDYSLTPSASVPMKILSTILSIPARVGVWSDNAERGAIYFVYPGGKFVSDTSYEIWPSSITWYLP